MGLFGGGNTTRKEYNTDSRTINDFSNAVFDSSVNDDSFTDNSTFSNDSSFTDNSVFSDSSNRSYNDNSIYSSSADYTDNSVINYLDGGAIAAGRDVSISALNMVAQSEYQLNETYKQFAISNENAADSALSVASNIANNSTGGLISDSNSKNLMYTAIAIAIVIALKGLK